MNTIEEIFNAFLTCTAVTTDTRKVTKGTMFFALKGERFDGNTFASQALALGANYVVVDNADMATDSEKSFLVDDVLRTMQDLSSIYRDTFDFPVLALTGSNGKTTTKELTSVVMSTIKKTSATIGNYNNHIGVPLTLLNTPPSTEFLIVEMGANHQGEIAFLCQIAKPDYVMITNIGLAHLEGFGGLEGIKKGKTEIYQYASANKKNIFINTEDPTLKSLLPENVNLVPYQSSDLILLENKHQESICFSYAGVEFDTQIYGDYNLPNIAFAIAVGKYFGASLEDIKMAICGYVSQNNRSQIKKIGNYEVILDAYNANPSSMYASLSSFSNLEAPKKMAILGDMLELGSFAVEEHTKLINFALSLDIEKVIFVGPIFKSIGKSDMFFENIESARTYFKSLELQDYTILLKGSRGIAVERILEA